MRRIEMAKITTKRVEYWNRLKKALRLDHVVLMEVLEARGLHKQSVGLGLLTELIKVVDHNHRLQLPSLISQMENKENQKKEVLNAIKEIVWMARRYADGRRTYAPSVFNESQKKLSDLLGVEVIGKEDKEVKDFPYATDPDVSISEEYKIKIENNDK